MSLSEWRRSKLNEYRINAFYYLSHKDNLYSILKNGILSYNQVIARDIQHTTFAEKTVQERRDIRDIYLTDNSSHNIHDLVPLYLTPRTPTLSARREHQNNLFFTVVQSYIICYDNINFAFSDGNAGSHDTSFYYSLKKLDKIDWGVIQAPYWTNFPDGARKRNAEFLIHPLVPVNRIWRFVVNNTDLKTYIESHLTNSGINKPVIIDDSYFF